MHLNLKRNICKQPLIAMMLIMRSIRNAGTTRWDPKISNKDHLFKEVECKKKEALKCCKKIMDHLDLTWDEMEEEIWKCFSNGDWNSPGKKIDLDFLHDDILGAL